MTLTDDPLSIELCLQNVVYDFSTVILKAVPPDCPWSPTVYERGQVLDFGYKWLAGLVSRVCSGGGGEPNAAQWTVRGDRRQRDSTDFILFTRAYGLIIVEASRRIKFLVSYV